MRHTVYAWRDCQGFVTVAKQLGGGVSTAAPPQVLIFTDACKVSVRCFKSARSRGDTDPTYKRGAIGPAPTTVWAVFPADRLYELEVPPPQVSLPGLHFFPA